MTHMTKDLDGICDMKDSLMRKVRGKMDDLDVERSTIQDVQGMDMMINMIHHLAEAEKCCWEACYYKTVVKAMKEGDDREGRDEDEDDDEEWIEHDDMPNRNRTSSGRFRRGNTVGRRYPGNERRDWGGDMGSDGGTIQHDDHDDHDPGRAAQPPQDGRRDHVEGRHSRATQAHQGESHQVVDDVDRLMRR